MYRAKVSFSGAIIMKKNEVREIKDKKLVKDLVEAGYIEEYKNATPKELQAENDKLKKELEEANATIEELNKKIEELTSDDATENGSSDDATENGSSDDEPKK